MFGTYFESQGVQYTINGDVNVSTALNNHGAIASVQLRLIRGAAAPIPGAIGGIFRNTGVSLTKLIGGVIEVENNTVGNSVDEVNVTIGPFRNFLRLSPIVAYNRTDSFEGHLANVLNEAGIVNSNGTLLSIATLQPPTIPSDTFLFTFDGPGFFEDFLDQLCDLIGADWYVEANGWLITPVPGNGPLATVLIRRRQIGVPLAQQGSIRFRLPFTPVDNFEQNYIGVPSIKITPPLASVVQVLGLRGSQGLIRQKLGITPVDAERIVVLQQVVDTVEDIATYQIPIDDFDEVNLVEVLDAAGATLASYTQSDDTLVLFDEVAGVFAANKVTFRKDQKQLIFGTDIIPENPKDIDGITTEFYNIRITVTIYYGFAVVENAAAVSYLQSASGGRGEGKQFNIEQRSELKTSAECNAYASEKAERVCRVSYNVNYNTNNPNYRLLEWQRVFYSPYNLNGENLRIAQISASYRQDEPQDIYTITLESYTVQPSQQKLNDLVAIITAPPALPNRVIGPGANDNQNGTCTCEWNNATEFLNFTDTVGINNLSLTFSQLVPRALFAARQAQRDDLVPGQVVIVPQVVQINSTDNGGLSVIYSGPISGTTDSGFHDIADIRTDSSGFYYFRCRIPVDGVLQQAVVRAPTNDPTNIVPLIIATTTIGAGNQITGVIADIAPNRDGTFIYFINVVEGIEGDTAECRVGRIATSSGGVEYLTPAGPISNTALDTNELLSNQASNIRRLAVYTDTDGNDLLFVAQARSRNFSASAGLTISANDPLLYVEERVDGQNKLRLIFGGGSEDPTTAGNGTDKDLSSSPIWEIKPNSCDNAMVETGFRRIVMEVKSSGVDPAFVKPLDVYANETIDPPIRPISVELKPFAVDTFRPTTTDGLNNDLGFIEDITSLLRIVTAENC